MTQDSGFADLLARARAGAVGARAELIERFLPDVTNYLGRDRVGWRVAQKESQSDLMQSVSLRVLSDLESFEGSDEASFRAWLRSAVRHKLIDKQRFWGAQRRDVARDRAPSQSRFGLALQHLHTPSRQAMAREEIERLEAAFERLPEEFRDVIHMRCVLGLSSGEVARRMERTPAAIRKLLSRARARLAMIAARG